VVDESLAGSRHVPPDRRGFDIRRGGAIEQRLLDGKRRAEVVRGIGVIERIEGEPGRGELPLRKQRAEHEHRVVAALPGLREVHLREVAAASLCDAIGRFPLGCRRRSGVGVAGFGARESPPKAKAATAQTPAGPQTGGQEDWNGDASCAHGPILRGLSLAGHARAFGFLDRQSGETRRFAEAPRNLPAVRRLELTERSLVPTNCWHARFRR
jgi:hypothetical protein